MTKLDKRLQDALEQIEAGADPEGVIAGVSAALPPAEAAELASLIRLAVMLRKMPHPAAQTKALPRSLVDAARDLRTQPQVPRLRRLASEVYVFGFALLLLAIFVGVFILPAFGPNPGAIPTITAALPSESPEPTPTLPSLSMESGVSGVITPLPGDIEPIDIPSPTPEPAYFEVVGDQPVIRHGDGDDWDSRYTDPGALVVFNGDLLMLRNGGMGWPERYFAIPMVSEDGVDWNAKALEPTFDTDAVPFKPVTALISSVLVEDDGSLVAYFWTIDSRSAGGFYGSRIGRATAPEMAGPWAIDAEPVLLPGESGAWDSRAVLHPSVIRTEGGEYRMYYTGAGGGNPDAIGLATSPDGITWTKYDHPATTTTLFAASDPIFTHGLTGQWDQLYARAPSVVFTDDGYVMAYQSATSLNGSNAMIGLALSDDGITWERHPENPVFEQRQIRSGNGISAHKLVCRDDTYYLYMEITVPAGVSNIWLATHEGSVRQ